MSCESWHKRDLQQGVKSQTSITQLVAFQYISNILQDVEMYFEISM